MRDRLYRSRDERVLFGVCGGVAEWLDLDPSLVRVVWALLFFAGGIGFLLYVVMAFVVPEEPEGYVPSYMADRYMATNADAGATAASATGTGATTVDPATGETVPPPAGAPVGAPVVPPGAPPWEVERARRRAEREQRRAERRANRGDGRGAIIFGVILVVAGLWFLARDYFPFLRPDLFGPALLIVVGVLVVALAVRRSEGPR